METFFIPFSLVYTLYPVLSPSVSSLDSIISPPVSMLDSISSWFDLTLTTFPTVWKEKIFKQVIKYVSYIHIKIILVVILQAWHHNLIQTCHHTLFQEFHHTLFFFVRIALIILFMNLMELHTILRIFKPSTNQYSSLLHVFKPTSSWFSFSFLKEDEWKQES